MFIKVVSVSELLSTVLGIIDSYSVPTTSGSLMLLLASKIGVDGRRRDRRISFPS